MTGFSDYHANPDENVSIGGFDVGEGCPPGNLNDAIRQLMADGKQLADQFLALPAGMPVGGGNFTGEIARTGQGAYLHYASSALADGRVHVQPEGMAYPAAPGEGAMLFLYT